MVKGLEISVSGEGLHLGTELLDGGSLLGSLGFSQDVDWIHVGGNGVFVMGAW